MPNLSQECQLRSGIVENLIFQRFSRENVLVTKQFVSCFGHINKLFLLLKAKYKTKLVERPKIKRHPHTAKAISSPDHIYKKFEQHGKLTSLGLKSDKHKST